MAASVQSVCCRTWAQFCPRLCRSLRGLDWTLSGRVAQSLQERLQNVGQDVPGFCRGIDIGFPPPREAINRSKENVKKEFLKKVKDDHQLELASRHLKLKVPLDEVQDLWRKSVGPGEVKAVAEHYGVYRDLFESAHFYPWVPLTVKFANEDFNTPVRYGNHVKPSEATSQPEVTYDADKDSLWTLILTNLDCHYEDSSAEYLHWFVGNIPSNDVRSGDVVCDYLQPFPARGTGFHRFVCVLYRQDGKIDYGGVRRTIPCLSLRERTFRTFDFYRARQGVLTPAGLAFFQCDWDESLTDFFHNTLKMREPVFEYDHPPPYVNPQVWNPHKVAFDAYLDKYRDPKEVAEEVLQMRLKKVDPFAKAPPPPRFPLIHREDFRCPTWLKNQRLKQVLRIGKYRDL